MDGITLFGIVSTVLGVTRALPQLIRLLRARHAHGVSVDSAATSTIISSGWAVYGVLTQQPVISLASGATGIIFAVITLSALRFGRRLRELKLAPVWFAVLLLLGGIGGATGLSIVLPISALAANSPQVWIAYRESNLADLSLGTWLLAMAEGLLWGGYGLVRQDIAVLVNNAFQLTTSTIIVAFKLAHMARTAKQSKAPLLAIGSTRNNRRLS
jgi:uncharacterized protein with PQ loop repeat